jgi:hypothetical protein
MSRAPGKYVAGTMAPAGAALDRPDLEALGTDAFCHGLTDVRGPYNTIITLT